MRTKIVGFVLAILLVLSTVAVTAASEELAECPYDGGMGAVRFVNPKITQFGKNGRVWRLDWSGIDPIPDGKDGYDMDWFDRVRAVEFTFVYVHTRNPDKFGVLVQPPIRVGTQQKNRHRLLSLDQPGFIRHRMHKSLSKNYARWYLYRLLCADE